MNKIVHTIIVFAITVTGIFSFQAHAATYQIDAGGQLIGATGVNVEGVFYDVSFGGGICPDFWDRCGDLFPAFTFPTKEKALAAARALITDVFSADDMFDTTPALTNGCDDPSSCFIITPFALDGDGETVFAVNALNLSGGGVDTTFPATIGELRASIGTYTPTNPDATYAKWTPSLSPVPIPPAIWLFASALIGLFGMAKHKVINE